MWKKRNLMNIDYNYIDPKEALKELFIIKKNNVDFYLKKKKLAKLAGLNEATLFRHLKGTSKITRKSAIKYAKVLDCHPAEILFKKKENK